jgi:hypothetical protein
MRRSHSPSNRLTHLTAVRTDLAAGIVSFLFTDIEGGREALWYRIPDSAYVIAVFPYVFTRSTDRLLRAGCWPSDSVQIACI